MTCSCGDPNPHVTMKRRTADDVTLWFWDDGAVTRSMGFRLKGIPYQRAPASTQADRVGAAQLFAAVVELFDLDECADLWSACRWAAKRGGAPGDAMARYRARAERKRLPILDWQVTSADRNGKPTERCAILPRLQWPGMMVWDTCGGPGSAGGRYHIYHRFMEPRHNGPGVDPVWRRGGLQFNSLQAMWAQLEGDAGE